MTAESHESVALERVQVCDRQKRLGKISILLKHIAVQRVKAPRGRTATRRGSMPGGSPCHRSGEGGIYNSEAVLVCYRFDVRDAQHCPELVVVDFFRARRLG